MIRKYSIVRRRPSGTLAAWLFIAFFIAGPAPALAAARLDLSFGHDGEISIEGGGPYHLAVDQSGGIAILAGRRILRYLPSGEVDRKFGVGGQVVPVELEGGKFEATDVAVGPQQEVFVFGAKFPEGEPRVNLPPPIEGPVSAAAVVRLNQLGGLDQAFGDGKGYVSSGYGLKSETRPYTGLEESVKAVAGTVDSQGRPVFLAGPIGTNIPCIGHTVREWFARAIIRLTPEGAPDPTFGAGDGVSSILGNFNSFPAPSLSIDAAGRPEVAGSKGQSCPKETLVVRADAAGQPLSSFGPAGRRFFPRSTFGAFAPSGKLILNRYPSQLLRVGSDGKPDRSFGDEGHLQVRSLPNIERFPAAVDSKGRTYLVGAFSRPTRQAGQKRAFVFVERLLPSGKPDLGFAPKARIVTAFPAARFLLPFEADFDPQGRLVLLSEVIGKTKSSVRAVLFRYRVGG